MTKLMFTESHASNKEGAFSKLRRTFNFRSNKICVSNESTPVITGLTIYVRSDKQFYKLSNVVFTTELYDFVKFAFFTTMKPTYTMSVEDMWQHTRCVLQFQGKPLSQRPIPLTDYNVNEGSVIDLTRYGGLGGAQPKMRQIILPTYTHVRECENQILFDKWKLQSGESDLVSAREAEKLVSHIMASLTTLKETLFSDNVWMFDLVESFFQIVYWFRRCENHQDYLVCTGLAFKLITGKGVSTTLWSTFGVTTNLQSEFSDCIRGMRDMYTTTAATVSNPLVEKIRQVYTYLLVQGFLKNFGKEMSPEEFLKFDRKTRIDYTDKTSLVMLIFDTAITICERLDAFWVTGDWHSLIHDDVSYAHWAKEADRLVSLAPFTSNLTPHGTTYFSFVSDLNDAIEKGEAICKYSKSNVGVESLSLRKKLNNLQLLKNIEVTRRASQKERKAPFGVLIHGGSSVAKSTFTKMLFYYYGKLHDLETDDHYRYVRNPTDEYWSNFDSSKWCIQMDDIAFLLPTKSNEVDPTLKEMLNVVNNVPYVPPQAALEDKGKTPVMAKLVLATTNAPDLNAQEYFHCPLAVRRRLPFVVRVEPKEKYLGANRKFIDPSKLPPIEGAFPDYWRITLQKLVPTNYHGRDSAKFEDVMVYDNVAEFLKVFAKASMLHEEIQEKSDTCDSGMKSIKVCKFCFEFGDACDCLQGAEGNLFLHFVRSWFCNFAINSVLGIFQHLIFTTISLWLCRFGIYKYVMARIASFMSSEIEIKFFGLMSGRRDSAYKISIRKLISVGSTITHLYAIYRIAKFSWDVTAPKAQKDEKLREHLHGEIKDDCDLCNPELQGNIFGTVETQLAKEESQNVWYNPTLELNQFDVPLPSQSMANLKPSEVRDYFAPNCVRLEIKALDADYSNCTGGVFVYGQYLLFNKHTVDKGTKFEINIISITKSQGLNSNLKCYFTLKDLKVDLTRDICMLRVRNISPFKNILKFWNDTQIPVTHVVSVRKERDGSTAFHELFNVNYCEDFPIEALDIKLPVYIGNGSVLTKPGDCGSLGVALTPRGPVILGIHTLGHVNMCGFPHTTKTQIESLCGDISLEVEGGGEPLLSLNGDVELLPPHHRSMLRYMPEGTVKTYGSFPGFRPKPRSRVTSTPLQKEMMEHFECEIKFGPPAMNGWEPWQKNVVEMIKPYTNVDESVLQICTDQFKNDIIKGLTNEHGQNWKKELVFLSDRASVNGLPGVKFIDRLNVSSSMGHPWNTGKKKYLTPDINSEYPDGVTFDEAVWERVNAIKQIYAEGKRAFPVFTGHLKDEATSFPKIAIKKTRVFTGAPVDWSLVVRSRLLSFVRLVQKNKFIFEAGPGTVCQSKEWTTIYDYLTQFGEDRIVAGDYGKFDKRMIARFILAAYEIIASIHKEAGFSDEEIREIMCIGTDTAFPLVNVNGDLMEFYGTNPSGHPLTVIINSIVNSLYMRYAYCMSNPSGKQCHDFKDNVSLFTYGDDNIMGVSPVISWFDHTVIQAHLSTIGVEYTMADKTSESCPFVHIDSSQFLKRMWRWEDELGYYTCPLDEESIHKSLTVWVPSDTIDKYKQMVDVISSANSEYFFYGRSTFEKHHQFFKEMISLEPYCRYVNNSTLPNWENLCVRYRKASGEQIS